MCASTWAAPERGRLTRGATAQAGLRPRAQRSHEVSVSADGFGVAAVAHHTPGRAGGVLLRPPQGRDTPQRPAQRQRRSILHVAAGLDDGCAPPPHMDALTGQLVPVHGRVSPQGQDAVRARERPEPGLRAVRLQPATGGDPGDPRVERPASRPQVESLRVESRQAVLTHDLSVPPSMPRAVWSPRPCGGGDHLRPQ